MADRLGGFESLPAKLRAKVYAKISRTSTAPSKTSKALCFPIVTSKGEVKGELVRNMKIFFDGIMEEWSKTWHLPRRIEMPTSIFDIPKVYIVIFKSYFRHSDLDLLDAPALLLLLLDLHISSITVTLYEKEEFVAPLEVMRADHIYRVQMACFIQCMMRSVSAGKYPLCNDGTQYVWKDDYNIKTITVR
jgi:hypothetical protein